MANRPILFSGPMVRALIAGTKTQTRRIFTPPLPYDADDDIYVQLATGEIAPKAKRDDRLYVREHWRTHRAYDDLAPSAMDGDQDIWFEADRLEQGQLCPAASIAGRFRQGMHMPRWASRLALTVTDVRVERDISEADAIAEGITRIGAEYIARGSTAFNGPNFYQVDMGFGTLNDVTATDVFRRLWEWINGEGSWNANPWIVAYTFTVNRGNIDQFAKEAA